MNIRKYIVAIVLVFTASLTVSATAFAEDSRPPRPEIRQMKGGPVGEMMRNKTDAIMMGSAVVGKVLTVSSSTLTMSAFGRREFSTTSATTTFSVDASNAVVLKDKATTTVSSIAVGDMVVVQGKITGTSIVATIIRDGIASNEKNASSTGMRFQQGNGQPVVAGTITTINGTTTLTFTNNSNTVYTADISTAKIEKPLTVGDHVIVQGTINGTSIVASTVIDQVPPKPREHHADRLVGGGLFQKLAHLFGF